MECCWPEFIVLKTINPYSFPENQIRYIAIADNFDSETENVMAPFQFAMNEVYLRDGSRKIKDVLRMKRQRGEYCACAPYGYMKHPQSKDVLVPNDDEGWMVSKQGGSAWRCDLQLVRTKWLRSRC